MGDYGDDENDSPCEWYADYFDNMIIIIMISNNDDDDDFGEPGLKLDG